MDACPADLRAVVHTPMRSPSPLEPYLPQPIRRAVHGDLLLISLEVAGIDLHQEVLVLGPVPPAEVFARAAAFFGPGVAYTILLEMEVAGALEAALCADGWQLIADEPALVLPRVPNAIPPPPPGLAIRRVTDAAGLAAFQRVSGTPPPFMPSLAAAQDPQVALLVGSVAGEPVATSRIACTAGVTDITGVVTAPASRRRGYGTALTWAAVAAGTARGCPVATLTATAMGAPIYRAMGFVPVGTFRTYAPPGRHPAP
jgi:ribosomal protein S18 acetylase RimI-like enzyme